MLRCRSSSPRGSRPERSRRASRARGAAPARRAVDLAVREHGHVALGQRTPAFLLPEGDAVHVAELGLERMDDLVLGLERALDLAAELDESRQLARLHLLLERGIEGAAVRRRRPCARRPFAPSAQTKAGTFRKRTERTRPFSTSAQVSSRPDGTSTTTWFSPSRALDDPLVERPRHERDRAVPARRRVARVVEEHDAEIRVCRRSAPRRSSRTCPRGRAARRRAAGGCGRDARERLGACRGSWLHAGSPTPPVTIRNGSPPVW